jgi:hypothetical protein
MKEVQDWKKQFREDFRFNNPQTGLFLKWHFSTTSVCRVLRMTCRFKSDHGNSAVHPCSWREVLGVTRSIEFPDKGSMSELSKPAGCSASEPIGSLVIEEGVVDPMDVGGRLRHLS